MKISGVILASSFLLQSSLLQAAVGGRMAIVDSAQLESATRPGYENIMYVLQSGSWSNSANCPTNFAYFNAKENPHFVATVLAARVSERPLQVYVDDSQAKLDGFCKIINMSL